MGKPTGLAKEQLRAMALMVGLIAAKSARNRVAGPRSTTRRLTTSQARSRNRFARGPA